MGSTTRHFLHSTSGNFAPTIALVLVPIILSGGIAVDYSNLNRHRSQYQDALDAAVLAAVKERSADRARRTARKVFNAHQPGIGIPKVSFKRTKDGNNVSASFGRDVSNSFMGIIGKPKTLVAVNSEAVAPAALSSIQFELEDAKGDYSKTVRLMIKPVGSSKYVEAVKAEYTSAEYSTGLWRVRPSGWVKLGEFTDAYMEMNIDPNSFGFHKSCSDCPTSIRSNDPEWSHRISKGPVPNQIDFPRGQAIDIFDLVGCGKTQRVNWEDGGGSDPDIVVNVKGLCNLVNNTMVRLVR